MSDGGLGIEAGCSCYLQRHAVGRRLAVLRIGRLSSSHIGEGFCGALPNRLLVRVEKLDELRVSKSEG